MDDVGAIEGRAEHGGFRHLAAIAAADALRQDRGLFAIKMAAMSETGLRYVPEYVLTQEQADGLGRGARAMIIETDSE